MIKKHFMKSTLLTLFTVCSIILIASCKKESNSSASITGRWNIQKVRAVETTTQSGSTVTQDTTVNYTNGEYINFASNGTFISGDGVAPSTDTGTYTYVNNTLTMISTDTTIFNVDLLDARSLNLSTSVTQNSPGIIYSINFTLYLTR